MTTHCSISHFLKNVALFRRISIKKGGNHLIYRHFHWTNRRSQSAASKLSSRGVIRLTGHDTGIFLQGLVTNDILPLMEKSSLIQYSMMLNVQGRVLYDLFLYNVTKGTSSPATVLVDVDAPVKEELLKILKRYKLRKKIDIADVSDEYTVWAHFQINGNTDKTPDPQLSTDKALCFYDPRVPQFANRIISQEKDIDVCEQVAEREYKIHRYKWGIPEGVSDLPPGNCLPLESNLSLMNGVSFQKGCYIGQELTARTFHTGVTRKRLMPVTLSEEADIKKDSSISTEKGKTAGKFRSHEGTHGLGLLRLAHVKDNLSVTGVGGTTVSFTCQAPTWWPQNILSPSTS